MRGPILYSEATLAGRSPLGRRLYRARLAAGLSQAALAELVGCDRTLISHWERGVMVPGEARLVRLREAVGW